MTAEDAPEPADDRRNNNALNKLPYQALAREPERLCTAHLSHTGEPCGNYRMRGQRVCRKHGGAALKARANAQRRLMEAADPIMAELVRIATDKNRDDDRKLRAIQDALNRVPGLSTREGVDVAVFGAGVAGDEQLRPFERLLRDAAFGGIARGPRPGRASSGAAEPTALPDDVLEAELIEEDSPSEPDAPDAPDAQPVARSTPDARYARPRDEGPMPRNADPTPPDAGSGYEDAALYGERGPARFARSGPLGPQTAV